MVDLPSFLLNYNPMSAVEMSCRWRGIVFIDKLGLSFQQSLPQNPVGFALGLYMEGCGSYEVGSSQLHVVAGDESGFGGVGQVLCCLQVGAECTDGCSVTSIVVARTAMRVHPYGYAVPFRRKTFLLIVNTHSKWPVRSDLEVTVMS